MKKNVLILILTLLMVSPCIAEDNVPAKKDPQKTQKNVKAWDFLVEHESAFVRYPSDVGYFIGSIVGIPITCVCMPIMIPLGYMVEAKDPFFAVIPLGVTIYSFSCLTGGVPYLIYESMVNKKEAEKVITEQQPKGK